MWHLLAMHGPLCQHPPFQQAYAHTLLPLPQTIASVRTFRPSVRWAGTHRIHPLMETDRSQAEWSLDVTMPSLSKSLFPYSDHMGAKLELNHIMGIKMLVPSSGRHSIFRRNSLFSPFPFPLALGRGKLHLSPSQSS